MNNSIEIKNVITVDDYNSVFPNTSSVDRIQKAISLSFFIIDGVCSGAITERWDYVGPDETKVLTATQKDFIRKAFVVQTQYIITCNLDVVNQSQSFSVGGLSFSNNKPQINQLCEAARNYLKKADLFYKTEFIGTSDEDCSLFKDMKMYVTYPVGDKRYLMTHDSESRHWKKLMYINSQGDVEYKSIEEIIIQDIATKEWVKANYYDKEWGDAINERIVALENAISIAYVINLNNNPAFVSTNEYIETESFTDVDGNTVASSSLPLGINIYNTDRVVPDRWYAGNNRFYVLNTEKPDLTNYYTKTEADNKFGAVIKEITAHQTVNTYEVPTLSVEDITDLYNSVVAGRPTLIHFDLNSLGITSDFLVEEGSNISDIGIKFLFQDTMILTYTIIEDPQDPEQEIVNITFRSLEQPHLYIHRLSLINGSIFDYTHSVIFEIKSLKQDAYTLETLIDYIKNQELTTPSHLFINGFVEVRNENKIYNLFDLNETSTSIWANWIKTDNTQDAISITTEWDFRDGITQLF